MSTLYLGQEFQMKIFGREPALYLAVIAASLNVAVALGLGGLTSVQAGLLVGAINAVGLGVAAVLVRPVQPAVVAAAVGAVGAAVAGFGFQVPPEVIAGLSALALPVLALLFRGQVEPPLREDGSLR